MKALKTSPGILQRGISGHSISLLAVITEDEVPISDWDGLYSALLEVSMNKVALWKSVRVDDRTAELAILFFFQNEEIFVELDELDALKWLTAKQAIWAKSLVKLWIFYDFFLIRLIRRDLWKKLDSCWLFPNFLKKREENFDQKWTKL